MSVKGATEMAKTQSEDALELQQKLSVEVQQILTIMENCISQAEIAASLPAALQLKGVSGVVDTELSRALQEHQILAERLKKQEGLKQESDGEQEGAAWDVRKRARAQLEKDIKNAVRDVLRLFRAHPDVILGLRAELGMEVEESEPILIRGLKMFHSHMVKQLDDKLQLVFNEQMSVSLAQDLERMIQQEKDVATDLENIDLKISQKNNEIIEVQQYLQKYNAQEKDTSLLTDKQIQEQIKTFNVKVTSTQQEIEQLSVQFNKLMLENSQEERILQQKNEKVEMETGYLLQDFDDEIKEIQANLELSKVGYEKEEEELRKLEKPFFILEAEYNQIRERRRLAEEKRLEEMKELELKTKAAIFAQAWWRGYSTRKALKNKGQSKKPKKGKGKKTR